jgi:hypothetical protein
MSLSEGICLLLERMELSKGFSKFQQQTSRPQTSKNSLIPSRALLIAVQASMTAEPEPLADTKLKR